MAYSYCKKGHFIGCSYCNDADEDCPLCELQALVSAVDGQEKRAWLDEWISVVTSAAGGQLRSGRPIDGVLAAMLVEREVANTESPGAVERAKKFLADHPPKTAEELAPKKIEMCWCRVKRRPHAFSVDCPGKEPTLPKS